ncbi:hypothetical protein DPSP01_012290 [Paraphaeosphaeria sporulosa]
MKLGLRFESRQNLEQLNNFVYHQTAQSGSARCSCPTVIAPGNMLANVGACLKQKAGPAAGKAAKGFVRTHTHVVYQGVSRLVAHGHTAPKRLALGSLNVPFVRAFEKPPPFPSA